MLFRRFIPIKVKVFLKIPTIVRKMREARDAKNRWKSKKIKITIKTAIKIQIRKNFARLTKRKLQIKNHSLFNTEGKLTIHKQFRNRMSFNKVSSRVLTNQEGQKQKIKITTQKIWLLWKKGSREILLCLQDRCCIIRLQTLWRKLFILKM